jgi:hypothetical protein
VFMVDIDSTQSDHNKQVLFNTKDCNSESFSFGDRGAYLLVDWYVFNLRASITVPRPTLLHVRHESATYLCPLPTDVRYLPISATFHFRYLPSYVRYLPISAAFPFPLPPHVRYLPISATFPFPLPPCMLGSRKYWYFKPGFRNLG